MSDLRINSEIELDNRLAVDWLEYWLDRPECNRTANDSIYLAACRTELRSVCRMPASPLPLVCRQRLACYVPPAATPDYWARSAARFPGALRDATYSPGNIAGNAMGALSSLDALYHSLPPTWHVKVQGGQWELYDANKNARKHAFGKSGKAKYPPRMMLRLKDAKIPEIPKNAFTRQGTMRISAPNARTVAQALQITEMNKFKPISQSAFDKLYARRFLTGNAVGAALAFGPTAYLDVRNAGGVSAIWNDRNARDRFILDSAKNQSTNAVGFGVSILAGAALVAVGVTSAPVLLVAGVLVGIASQTGFVTFGGDEWVQDQVKGLMR